MKLTDEQQQAIDGALEAITAKKQSYRIAGYAGTGKSTIMKHIASTQSMRTCAYTGKATNVLRKKGLPQSETIHRTIYEWDDRNERFIRKSSLGCDAIGLDEGSMVPIQIWQDLCSYHIPIVVVGDPGQLEPIGEDAKLMHQPDITLEQIHRYEGTIAWFANHVRKTGNVPTIFSDEVQVVSRTRFMDNLDELLASRAIILCGFNKTRVAINREIRKRHGFCGTIAVGEKLIFLHNDRDLGVFNGMIGEVTNIVNETNRYILADVSLDDGRTKHGLKIWNGHFHQSVGIDWRRFPKGMAIADYGYAVTVHKFQGSEDDTVAVIDEQCDLWDATRHRYTAFTRARNHLRVYV